LIGASVQMAQVMMKTKGLAEIGFGPLGFCVEITGIFSGVSQHEPRQESRRDSGRKIGFGPSKIGFGPPKKALPGRHR
jgi:hypothetical protein